LPKKLPDCEESIFFGLDPFADFTVTVPVFPKFRLLSDLTIITIPARVMAVGGLQTPMMRLFLMIPEDPDRCPPQRPHGKGITDFYPKNPANQSIDKPLPLAWISATLYVLHCSWLVIITASDGWMVYAFSTETAELAVFFHDPPYPPRINNRGMLGELLLRESVLSKFCYAS